MATLDFPSRPALLAVAACAALTACSGSDSSNPGTPPGGGGDAPGLGADPLLPNQWHLINTGQFGGTPGEDANVQGAWNAGVTGSGVRISIIDNGFQIEHPDLVYNVPPGGSYDYVDGDANPASGDHGSACGGVAAGVGTNARGISGAAYEAQVVGFNLLAFNTVANQANAMTRDFQVVDVSNNSWGPADELGVLSDSPAAWRAAIESGVATGRGGLGLVYCWAAGNGADAMGQLVDNSNYDGYANHFGVLAVGAVDNQGERSFYSERGANLWVSAPSSGNGVGVTTVDLTGASGYNDGVGSDLPDADYTATFGGTSSATPVVAGAVALMLEARPQLSWSDVRWILAETARRNDPGDPDWTTNGAGYFVNHNYGFGVVDASAAVTLAASWTPKSALVTEDSGWIDVPGGTGAIPDNNVTGIAIPFTISGSSLTEIEYLTCSVDVEDHDYWPDLELTLESPAGTESILCEQHAAQDQGGVVLPRLDDWRFGVARVLGEAPNGTWTLRARDLAAPDAGTITRVRFQFHGR